MSRLIRNLLHKKQPPAPAKQQTPPKSNQLPSSFAVQAVNRVNARQQQIAQNKTTVVLNLTQVQDYQDGQGLRQINWTVCFTMQKLPTQLQVTVRIKPITGNSNLNPNYQHDWRTHIESAWNCAKLINGNERLDIRFQLDFVTHTNNAYVVNVNNPPPQPQPQTWQEREAKKKQDTVGADVGTPDMANWGAWDKAAVIHEFGHMIGNPDEYYTKTFQNQPLAAQIYDQLPFTTDSIMNNTGPQGRIYPRHFDLIRQEYERWQGLAPNSTRIVL